MVPLENRIDYLKRINENNKLKAFNDLLLAEDFSFSNHQDLNESEEIYFGIVRAIQSSNKNDFQKFYDKKSKSKPNKDSHAPFVNDDFLIFSIILGVVKFGLDKSWLGYIISIRSRSPLAITFENILNENYFSTSNLPEIVLMFLQISNEKLINDKLVNFTFKKITENVGLFESRSDFQIICSLRAYDLILTLKELTDTSELDLYNKFNDKFVKRIHYLSWIIQLILFASLIYILLNLPDYSPKVIDYIDKYNYVFTIFGALGLSFLGNFIPVFKTKSQEGIMRALGYPKELIKR
jgi:hypothetical protein